MKKSLLTLAIALLSTAAFANPALTVTDTTTTVGAGSVSGTEASSSTGHQGGIAGASATDFGVAGVAVTSHGAVAGSTNTSTVISGGTHGTSSSAGAAGLSGAAGSESQNTFSVTAPSYR